MIRRFLPHIALLLLTLVLVRTGGAAAHAHVHAAIPVEAAGAPVFDQNDAGCDACALKTAFLEAGIPEIPGVSTVAAALFAPATRQAALRPVLSRSGRSPPTAG